MDFQAFPILYVDDEHANRVVMKHNLSRDFTLHIADSAESAMQILEREFVAVLLTDQRMPGVTGVELAEQTRERYPDIVRVIITAYSDLEATLAAINRARVSRFIKKPWTRDELVAVMKESIQAFQSARLIEQLQERLVQLDRLSSVAILGSAIAHDLKQPLGYIVPSLQLARDDVDELCAGSLESPRAASVARRIQEGLADIDRGVAQLKTMADALLKSLKGQGPSTKRLDLRQVIENAAVLTRGSATKLGGFSVQVPDEPVFVRASEGRLYQLVVNLVLNAVQALDRAHKSRNGIDVRLLQAGRRAIIEVEDTGSGIPEERAADIFKPLYTTKGEAGSGLGLAICQQVVDELGGTIKMSSRVGKGSRFTVALPVDGAEPK